MPHPRISDDMSTEPPSARWLVRALVRQASVRCEAPDNEARVAFEACVRTYEDLTRELGTVSAGMLVERARLDVGKSHPSLLFFRFDQPWDAGVAAFNASADNTSCPELTSSLESMLEALLTLVGRFVGIDIVVRLLAYNAPRESNDDGADK